MTNSKYDPLGRRIFKRDAASGIFKDTWFAYDGDDVIADYAVPERLSSGGNSGDKIRGTQYLIIVKNKLSSAYTSPTPPSPQHTDTSKYLPTLIYYTPLHIPSFIFLLQLCYRQNH